MQISRPKSSLWSSLDFSLPYFVLSLTLNILLSALLVLRICFLRFRTVSLMGKHEGKKYLSISAFIMESALLDSVFSVLFLVTYVLDYWIQFVWLQVIAMIQVGAPFEHTFWYWSLPLEDNCTSFTHLSYNTRQRVVLDTRNRADKHCYHPRPWFRSRAREIPGRRH